MAKKYYVWNSRSFGYLPRELYFLDANVLINAAFIGVGHYIRIVESNLSYCCTEEIVKEVRKIGEKEFNGVGMDYFENLLEKENFSRLEISDKRGLKTKELNRALSMRGISHEDKELITLLWMGLMNGKKYHIISSDHHIIDNVHLNSLLKKYSIDPSGVVYHPKDFAESLIQS